MFHGAPAGAVPEIITSGEGALGGTFELSARSQSRAPTRPARRATRRDPLAARRDPLTARRDPLAVRRDLLAAHRAEGSPPSEVR